MRFMLQVRADEKTESGVLPGKEMIEAMSRFNQEMIDAGIMLAADGLHPSAKGARVSFAGGKPRVIEPPFASPRELIAGFWMIDVPSRQVAIDWATRIPFPEGEVEIRQVHELADFPPEILSSETAAREQAWRDGQRPSRSPAA